MLIFGVVGFLMRKFDYPAAPLLLGFILGPLLEEHFRRALLLSQGNPLVFFERPDQRHIPGRLPGLSGKRLLAQDPLLSGSSRSKTHECRP